VSDRLANFFRKIVKETMEFRKAKNIVGKDFMQILIQLKETGTLEPEKETGTEDKMGTY
jgi:hypothetical protein